MLSDTGGTAAMKLFLSAYACEPGKGSEPGIGWNTALELARHHEVHVLTRANNLPSIREALSGYEGPKPVFHGYDLPRWLTFWKRKRRGYHLYYYLWQYGAFFRYRALANRCDVVQHLTFANWAMPSLFMLCRPVTVYGPIGEVHTPEVVFRSLPWRVGVRERLRTWGMWLFTHLEPFRVLTPRGADVILESGHPEGRSGFSGKFLSKIRRQHQTGINPGEAEYEVRRGRESDGKVRLLICSEFVHWKGVTYACEVFGRIASMREDVELHIYGKGPERAAMERILARHGVSGAVRWFGFVGKREMLQALCDADILLYPSYHHGLATLILQAMWAGLPIVAMLDDPVALAVGEGAGVVAQGATMEEVLDDMQVKTLELIDSEERRRQLGQRGRELVRERYAWSKTVERLSRLLEEAKAACEASGQVGVRGC